MSNPRSDDALREAMMAELRAVLDTREVPGYAMTIHDIVNSHPGTTYGQWKKRLRELIDKGKWTSKRMGPRVYYWKVE